MSLTLQLRSMTMDNSGAQDICDYVDAQAIRLGMPYNSQKGGLSRCACHCSNLCEGDAIKTVIPEIVVLHKVFVTFHTSND